MKIAVCCDCGACRQVEMADAPSIGDPAISKPLPSHHFVHVTDEDHHLHLRAKRDREDVYVDGSEHYVLQHTGVDEDEDGSGLKKQKLDSSMGDSLDDDPLLDDLKTTSLVVGGMGVDTVVTSHGLGLGISYFATTGNIKSPIFEGIPSLTPEWLLKKVWLKVNGDLEQSVLASLISKDMGPKLRQEIRAFLEKRGEIHTGNRINLKNTIMQAVEITITCQKEKPTLTILRDPNKRAKKEGKQEKNFNIGLTPYGQSVCMAELQLKKRDSFAQRTPTKLGLNMSMNLGMSLGDSSGGISPLSINVPAPSSPTSSSSPPTSSTPSSLSSSSNGLPHSPLASAGHPLAMNMGLWKPNVKEMNDELLKRNVQAGELNEIMMLKEECHKRDMIIAELKGIITQFKSNYQFPHHLNILPIMSSMNNNNQNNSLNGLNNINNLNNLNNINLNNINNTGSDGVVALLETSLNHHHHHPHLSPHHHHHQLQLHQNDHSAHLLHIDHPALLGETMMAQAVDHQGYLPQ